LSTDVSEVRAAAIIRALLTEAARTSETSVDNPFTRQYIPEDKSELYTRRRENLKSQIMKMAVFWDAAPCSLVEINHFRFPYCSFIRAMSESGKRL
jgi:hypothetical protein